MSEPTREELIETILDCVNQGCEHERDRYSDDTALVRRDLVGHQYMSTYESAFDVLERCGHLEYIDEGRYWARLIWNAPEEASCQRSV